MSKRRAAAKRGATTRSVQREIAKQLAEEGHIKPGETRKAFSDQFATLEDLRLCVEKIQMVSNQEPSMIQCEGELELERECLTDGSIVYNVHLHGDMCDEEHDARVEARSRE